MATPIVAINEILQRAADTFGISFDYLSRVAQIESGYGQNPLAYDDRGAQGLFQFMPGTAAQYQLWNPLDDESNAFAAARLTRDNFSMLAEGLGRAPTNAELYLAHQQGATGALRLLNNPDTLATDILGTQAVVGNVGGQLTDTAQQFAQRVLSYYNDGANPEQVGTASVGNTTVSLDPEMLAAGGNWFLRIVIIVLGFIFVAVGLSMFKGPAVIQTVLKGK